MEIKIRYPVSASDVTLQQMIALGDEINPLVKGVGFAQEPVDGFYTLCIMFDDTDVMTPNMIFNLGAIVATRVAGHIFNKEISILQS